MNKKAALSLLFSMLYVVCAHAANEGRFSYYPDQQLLEQSQPLPLLVVPPVAQPVVIQPGHTSQTGDTRTHTTINCCSNNNCSGCCAGTDCGDDKCVCPVSVDINPWVSAALNLFTCGGKAREKGQGDDPLSELKNAGEMKRI